MSPCRQAPLAAALVAILCIDLALIAGCVSVPDSSAAVAPTCPFGSDPSADDFNPVTIANRALGSLFYDGQIAEAYACHAVAAAGIHPSQSDESWALAIEQNKRLLELLLGPRRPGSPRVYHNATGLTGCPRGNQL